MSAAFAVTEGDGHGGSVHAVEEDGGGGGGVEDLDFAVSRFVLLAGVSLETGPGGGAGDEGFEAGEELAAVADAVGTLALLFVGR